MQINNDRQLSCQAKQQQNARRQHTEQRAAARTAAQNWQAQAACTQQIAAPRHKATATHALTTHLEQDGDAPPLEINRLHSVEVRGVGVGGGSARRGCLCGHALLRSCGAIHTGCSRPSDAPQSQRSWRPRLEPRLAAVQRVIQRPDRLSGAQVAAAAGFVSLSTVPSTTALSLLPVPELIPAPQRHISLHARVIAQRL